MQELDANVVHLPARYRLLGELGEGGMGRVLRAHDEERGADVAVKILHEDTADALLEIKHEFRVLAGLAHPNLCVMYDLDAVHRPPFFTMEYVDGTDIHEWLLRAAPASWERALSEMLAGLAALHEEHVLHRDVKPTNVLVDEAGRVVLLDFGLALGRLERDRSDGLTGTLEYLAPEVLSGGEESEASDVYSSGALFYAALMGDEYADLALMDRVERRMPHPIQLGANADLAKLLWAMLDPEPSRRPSAATAKAVAAGERVKLEAPSFVGRREEIAVLTNALHASRDRAIHVSVTAPSGLGKTTLIQAFIESLAKGSVQVLSGRSHLNEATPFQALDAIMDGLAVLVQQRHDLALMVEDDDSVAQMFPAFQTVVQGQPSKLEASFLRARSLRTLRALLRQLAVAGPLLLWIDDAQWADADSIRLLEDLLAPPAAPRVLCVTTTRSGDRTQRPWALSGIERIEVTLGALSLDDAMELAMAMHPDLEFSGLRTLVEDQGGDPFLLATPTSQSAMLPGDERLVLRAAVAGRPLTVEELAFDLSLPDAAGRVRRLEGQRWLRRDPAGRYAPYHERRVKFIVDRTSTSDISLAHSQLADALLEHGEAQPGQVLRHLEQAGRTNEVFPYALQGAERAHQQLAFDRAATMLATALRSAPESETRILRRRLADTLALAGRGQEAAQSFLELAADAEPREALELEQRACEQYLFSGHQSEGAALVRQVLRKVRSRPPGPGLLALVEIRYLAATRKFRNLVVDERQSPRQSQLDRLDALHAIALGLSWNDPLASAALGCRYVHQTLEHGDDARVALALGLNAVQSAFDTYRPERNQRALALALQHANATGSAEANGLHRLAVAGVAWAEGRYREAVAQTRDECVELSRDAPGLRWHRDTWSLVHLECLTRLGDFTDVAVKLPATISDARLRGDLHLELNMRARVAPMYWLAMDEPEEAERWLHEALAAWPEGGRTIQFLATLRQAQIDMYRGDPDLWGRFRAGWREAERSFMLSLGFHRVIGWPVRARAVLWAERQGLVSTRFRRREIRKALRGLQGLGPAASAEASAVSAEGSFADGRQSEARQHLAAAVRAYEELGMQAHCAAARDASARWLPRTSADGWGVTGIRSPMRFGRVLFPQLNAP